MNHCEPMVPMSITAALKVGALWLAITSVTSTVNDSDVVLPLLAVAVTVTVCDP